MSSSNEVKEDLAEDSRSPQELVRLEKLEKLTQKGFKYPNDVHITASTQELKDSIVSGEPSEQSRFTLAGRILRIRHMGKASFCHILDQCGELQIYVKKDILGEEIFEVFQDFDIGDLIEVKGYGFLTKTGEKSLFVEGIRLLVKCLIPLPEKWHGLTDVDARYRQRYVDLIANPDVREVFRTRARIISTIRQFFDDHGFLEVETPVLQYQVGGANAKPFQTFYNALDTQMILRIAPELPLKKLVVGGLERVYEFARNFRNEGLSRKHNPEFTMMEFYRAYATFEDNMDLTEDLFEKLVQTIKGGMRFTYDGIEIDATRPWKRISMLDSIHEIGGVSKEFDLATLEGVKSAASAHKVRLSDAGDWGKGLEDLWSDLVEAKLINPTYITHHPFSISPLARKNDQNPDVTDRFELIMAGMEIANGYSELNDPIDQRERFVSQASRKASGDEEACEVDEDFLRALEYGLPPTSGEGIGIDRLVMLLSDARSIRDVVLFPQLKPL